MPLMTVIGLERYGLQTYDGHQWQTALSFKPKEQVAYKYLLINNDTSTPEHGTPRLLDIPTTGEFVFLQDFWRPQHEVERNFFSAAFKDVIFKRKTASQKVSRKKRTSKNTIQLQLNAAAIPQHLTFCVLGNIPALGDWKKPLILSDQNFPLWQASFEVDASVDLEYKFALYDPAKEQIVEWEAGENRKMRFNFPSAQQNKLIWTDERYRRAGAKWKGAGVAAPVFSLRSKKGLGIGEYSDIPLLVDWAVQTGLKIVQILPVNDTTVTKTWKDSYPYRAISVFALHPMYINIEGIAKLKDKKDAARLKRKTTALNKLEAIDLEKVFAAKMEFFQLLFKQEKAAFLKSKQAKDFIESNKEWLKAYAVFCHLRDEHGTAVFSDWKEHSVYTSEAIDKLSHPKSTSYDAILFYYFLQFHAHLQLFGATEYARTNGVVLKGDLPIGIARESCDAWAQPHLYNMNGQAGAPPDFYAENGQNWGFPTYNWEEMAKDNFKWWRQRMGKLAEYFDALRIDHILGFFRIWEIPTDQVIGTMGVFNPRLPYTKEDLANFGLYGNLDRYTKPYIRGHFLTTIFGEDAAFVQSEFLNELSYNVFELKDKVKNQLLIQQLFDNNPAYADKVHIAKGLMKLVGEVLLLSEPNSNETTFNPRITLTTTRSFQELPKREQQIFDRLYNDYHFDRHNDFWRQQAMWKLPVIQGATNIFICAEDLGMIPASVPGVMQELNILTLEIQRMAKGNTTFGEPEHYPYTSVCSPSCHDMSTVRGWWEEDFNRSNQFFHTYIDRNNPTPKTCTPGVVEAINWQHFQSPSMWAIFPIQDLIGMDGTLRRADAKAEQINEPSIPFHYWRFRFHINLEDLLNTKQLNDKIKGMVHLSGR